jgi:hypothetical protein
MIFAHPSRTMGALSNVGVIVRNSFLVVVLKIA